jgi:hypothetical protein
MARASYGRGGKMAMCIGVKINDTFLKSQDWLWLLPINKHLKVWWLIF